ncbi:MAG TPA: hypothetical protein VJ808_10895 [Gemmatimonadales bacterium]|nr:hypothetical protein [Gemmatimonadales bacterium]
MSSEGPLQPIDSTVPSGDSIPTPGPDTVTPPPPLPPTDTTAPPPSDTTAPYTPVHTGIPFGPFVYNKGESEKSLIPPSSLDSSFNALSAAAYRPVLLAQLEAARRANDRVLISLAGSSYFYTDANGFNLEVWKRRTDRFRGLDLTSYIADGTLIGNFIMDEPHDPVNWNGHVVSLADIEEMARYSKEIWPDLPTIIRGWPAQLKGHPYVYLDAAWAQYSERFGSLDEFIEKNVREAKEAGLGLVAGLNVLGGGGKDGIPGFLPKKNSMNASQLRAWGARYLSEPHICAFFIWSYRPDYMTRPDIKAALEEIGQKARSRPNKSCKR